MTNRRTGRTLARCSSCERTNVRTPVDAPDHVICSLCWGYEGDVMNVHYDNCTDGMLPEGPCAYCSGLTLEAYIAQRTRKANSGRTQSASTASKAGTLECPCCERALPETKFPTRQDKAGNTLRDWRECRSCRDARKASGKRLPSRAQAAVGRKSAR